MKLLFTSLLIITALAPAAADLMAANGPIEISLSYVVGKTGERGFKGDFFIGYDTVQKKPLKMTAVMQSDLLYDFIIPNWSKSKLLIYKAKS